jgi:uncharacterized membrane protein/glutaredoxin
MLTRKVTVLLLPLLLLFALAPAAQAQENEETAVVHAIMFWMDGCPYCHDVIDYILPPMQAEYGESLNVQLVEIISADDVDRLYDLALAVGLARNQVGVPLMIVGDRVLIGPYEIRDELPKIVDAHLPGGGLALPKIPALTALLNRTPPEPPPPIAIAPAQLADGTAVVRAVMFWMDSCPYCHQVMDDVLPILYAQYGDQLEVQLIEVASPEAAEALYQAAEAGGLRSNQVGVPLMLVGDQVLIGPYQIRDELPKIVDAYLPSGGLDFVRLSAVAPFLPDAPAPEPLTETEEETVAAPITAPEAPPAVGAINEPVSDGFTLAIVILVGMTAAMIYTAVRFWQAGQGKPLPVAPGWFMTGLPLLALVGLGVAGYLAYIETQPVIPICGPVGDCQAVQQSEYAYLFGIPIGVIGVVGYLAILAAWLWGAVKNDNRAFLLLLGMTGAGVLFSIYPTYLEPFVIGAVCAWCLSSAVIITLLMLMSLGLIQDKPSLRGEHS